MLYIRTKDTILKIENISAPTYVVGKGEMVAYHYYDKYGNYRVGECLSKYVKKADTIEELCDLFVLYDNKRFVIADTDFDFVESVANNVNNSIKCPILHGCINTDKGLIYVAELNEKGKIELL